VGPWPPIGAGVSTKATASYTHVDPEGRFTFGSRDGSEQTVSADEPFVTSDAGDIAYLDACPFVECVDRTEEVVIDQDEPDEEFHVDTDEGGDE